jgi:hypothetical protein
MVRWCESPMPKSTPVGARRSRSGRAPAQTSSPSRVAPWGRCVRGLGGIRPGLIFAQRPSRTSPRWASQDVQRRPREFYPCDPDRGCFRARNGGLVGRPRFVRSTRPAAGRPIASVIRMCAIGPGRRRLGPKAPRDARLCGQDRGGWGPSRSTIRPAWRRLPALSSWSLPRILRNAGTSPQPS